MACFFCFGRRASVANWPYVEFITLGLVRFDSSRYNTTILETRRRILVGDLDGDVTQAGVRKLAVTILNKKKHGMNNIMNVGKR